MHQYCFLAPKDSTTSSVVTPRKLETPCDFDAGGLNPPWPSIIVWDDGSIITARPSDGLLDVRRRSLRNGPPGQETGSARSRGHAKTRTPYVRTLPLFLCLAPRATGCTVAERPKPSSLYGVHAHAATQTTTGAGSPAVCCDRVCAAGRAGLDLAPERDGPAQVFTFRRNTLVASSRWLASRVKNWASLVTEANGASTSAKVVCRVIALIE